MAEQAETAEIEAQSGDESTLWRKLARVYVGTTVVAWPFTDLAMRFFVALPFLRSGYLKASDWPTAVDLATYEYPVSWMAPQSAAATGLAIELIAPLLLLLGFLTRPAAFAMAVLMIISQVVYIPTTTNLMLIAMLAWYVIYGPASISLDFYWTRQSALADARIVKHMVAVGKWSRENLPGIFLLAMRVWLGVSLLALAGEFEPSIALATWLPSTSFFGLPYWVAILFAILLFTGTAASPVSYTLTFVVAAFMISGVHPSVTLYPVLLLGLYDSRGAGALSVDQSVERLLAKKYPSLNEDDIDQDDWIGTLKGWWDDIRDYYKSWKESG